MVTVNVEVFPMKNTYLAFIIISIFSTGIVSAQETTVASSQKVPESVATPKVEPARRYLLAPGDEITGKVLGEQDYNFVVTVNEDGRIEVPFFEKPIMAMCKTESELRGDLTELLKRDLKNPQLSLRTEIKSRPKTTVTGEVEKPQTIELTRRATLVELVAFSGGFKTEASGLVQVFRPQPPPCATPDDANYWKPETGNAAEVPSKIFSVANIKMGKEDSNPVILPGDIIVVQKAPPVYITGEVVAPQGIYLKEGGTTLMDALSMVSGLRQEAKTKEIKIYRQIDGTKDRAVILANLDLIKKGEAKDVLLEPYDLIEVGKAKKPIGMLILEFAIGTGKAAITAAANSTGYSVIY